MLTDKHNEAAARVRYTRISDVVRARFDWGVQGKFSGMPQNTLIEKYVSVNKW